MTDAFRRRIGVSGLAISLILLVGWFSYRLGESAIGTRPADEPVATPITVVSRVATLSDTRPLEIQVEWPEVGSVHMPTSGIVTDAPLADELPHELTEGELLVRIDEKPSYVAIGRVPSFRELTLGDRGRDVEQFNRMLNRMNYLTGPAGDLWTASTTAA